MKTHFGLLRMNAAEFFGKSLGEIRFVPKILRGPTSKTWATLISKPSRAPRLLLWVRDGAAYTENCQRSLRPRPGQNSSRLGLPLGIWTRHLSHCSRRI